VSLISSVAAASAFNWLDIQYSSRNPFDPLVHHRKPCDRATERRRLQSRDLDAERIAAAAGVHDFAKTPPVGEDQSAVVDVVAVFE